MALGNVAFVAAIALGFLADFDVATIVVAAASGVAVALAGYSWKGLIPRMEAAGEDGFERYHRQSVVLNGLMMLAVAIGLVASHVPQ